MDIRQLELVVSDEDLTRELAEHLPRDTEVKDLRVRVTPEGIRLTGVYPTLMLAVAFDTLWSVTVPYLSAGELMNLYFDSKNIPTPNRMNWKDAETDEWLRLGRSATNSAAPFPCPKITSEICLRHEFQDDLHPVRLARPAGGGDAGRGGLLSQPGHQAGGAGRAALPQLREQGQGRQDNP